MFERRLAMMPFRLEEGSVVGREVQLESWRWRQQFVRCGLDWSFADGQCRSW